MKYAVDSLGPELVIGAVVAAVGICAVVGAFIRDTRKGSEADTDEHQVLEPERPADFQWPKWPVTREKGDRQPQAGYYRYGRWHS